MHDVCTPTDLEKKSCILERPSQHLQARLLKVAREPHLYNRRGNNPNRGRGREVLLAVQTGPPHQITLECMTAYMLISMERVNKTWSVRLQATAIHLQRFCYEAVHGAVDRCTVCHANLKGYEDRRCVSCYNGATCRECVQEYDPKFSQGREIFESEYDWNSLARGKAVCLQCAIVCESGRLRKPLLSGMMKAADAMDAVLGEGDFHPGKILPRLYFQMWKEVLSSGKSTFSILDDENALVGRRAANHTLGAALQTWQTEQGARN